MWWPRADRCGEEVTVRAGVAVEDITPARGTAMSGFAARRDRAAGAHDRLLVEALVVEDTAVITVDVVEIGRASCRERRWRTRAAGSLQNKANDTESEGSRTQVIREE